MLVYLSSFYLYTVDCIFLYSRHEVIRQKGQPTKYQYYNIIIKNLYFMYNWLTVQILNRVTVHGFIHCKINKAVRAAYLTVSTKPHGFSHHTVLRYTLNIRGLSREATSNVSCSLPRAD